MRLARAFTRRNKILKFDGAFHGHSDYARQALGTEAGRNDLHSIADSAGIPKEISETVIIAPYNDLERTRQIAEPVAHEIAAILVEPVQRSFMPAPGFLEGLRALADKIGAVLVFDEVVTGFRLSLGGAQELFGVTPDLCALGKIVGGGLPLAAVAGRADILELTIPGRPKDGRSVFMSGTLNGNPLACAAGLATLAVLEEVSAPAVLREKGEALAAGLAEIANRLSIPFLTIGAPAFQQPVFGNGPFDNAEALALSRLDAAYQFGLEMVRGGVLFSPGSKLYMSVVHTDETQALLLEAAERAMRAVRDQGLLH
jgi:glutamate-1-semialdehyde 2,1-aminomutase